MRPFNGIGGLAEDPAWSPDGRTLTFAAAQDKQPSHIYIKGVSSGAPVRLTNGKGQEARPVWSPDGKEIAFVQDLDYGQFAILRVNLQTHVTAPVGRFSYFWPLAIDQPTLDWSPDGRFLLTSEQTSPSTPVQLVRVNLATGERSPLTSPPVNVSGDFDGKFSPKGESVAFRRGGLGDLYVVPSEGEQQRAATRLTFDTKGVRGIAWTGRGASLLFGTQRGPTSVFAIWNMPVSGGSPRRVTPVGFDAVSPALSPVRGLLVAHREVEMGLVTQSLDGSPATPVLPPTNAIEGSPAYAPDGSALAFLSTRSGWNELWLQRLNRGSAAPVQLTHLAGAGLIFFPSWAPDGRSIVFSLRQHGATNVVVLDLRSKTMREITSTRNRDFGAVYGTEGRFIYFSSNDDGVPRIWRARADGSGRPEPLFVEAATGFVPSEDGHWLYWLRRGPELTLMRHSLLDQTTEEVLRLPGHPTFLNSVEVANHSVYVAVSGEDLSISEILRIDPESKHVQTAAHLTACAPSSQMSTAGFAISPDGRVATVTRMLRATSSFFLAPPSR